MDTIKETFGAKGFRAQFSKAQVEVPEGSILKFDRVVSNVNECYDASTGVFTAQETGVYSLYLSGVGDTDQKNDFIDLAIDRRKDNSRPYGPLTRVYLKPYGDFLLGCQGSGSVKVKLNKGEQVVVRHTRGDLVLKGGRHTTFSGVLEYDLNDPFHY